MKVALFGCRGMLGRDCDAALRRAGHEVAGYDLPELDITRSRDLERLPRADWAVNAAAYTDVDGAETDRAAAFAVNADGAGLVARWCAARGVPLLHISTDYVFDGRATRPYDEAAAPHPLNVYGASKLAGEQAVQDAGAETILVRTQSLFGPHGRHFVRAIVGALQRSGDPLPVVTEQCSSPTYTPHLAAAILRLLPCGQRGIVHVAASGQCSWYAFARAIARRLDAASRIVPAAPEQAARPARRPRYAVLDTRRYTAWTGHRMPAWQEGLNDYFAQAATRDQAEGGI